MKDKFDKLYEEMLKEAKLPKSHMKLISLGDVFKKSLAKAHKDWSKFQKAAFNDIGHPQTHDKMSDVMVQFRDAVKAMEEYMKDWKNIVKQDAEDIADNDKEGFGAF